MINTNLLTIRNILLIGGIAVVVKIFATPLINRIAAVGQTE